MSRLTLLIIVLALIAGCKHIAATRDNPASVKPIRVSASGIDAAEPAIVSANDGTFYVAWVNHDAKQADVMLAHF
jgi:uncharacterized protein YcfL